MSDQNQGSYGEFALFYDQLMADAPYQSWMVFLEEALTRNGLSPRHIADLGCGTGTISLMLHERGYKVTGVDLSEDMLAQAEAKLQAHSPRLRFLCQDVRELILPEKCDVAIAFCDGLNYILDEDSLGQAFARVKSQLRPGGMFLFDMHTIYKLREKLGQNVFYEVGEEVTYLWQSRYEQETATVEYDITFFAIEDEEEQLYRRFHERHVQRAYERSTVEQLLTDAGFQTVQVYADFGWDVPTESTERYFFLAR
ncbi:class I SAM-dependent DNA methyltransferase [Tumebacillus lipolyticus]|uniref:Class I SAM-dependent DNA methyltransferase n=1 Tax=Tumebacillus lipolyticus TaxID=1280370 RepID=A0ABW4ZV79_9BACL